MKLFTAMFLAIVMTLLFGSVSSYAGGDQVGKDDANPVFSVDGTPVGLQVNIPEGCEAAVLQSQVIIFCDKEE